MAKNMKSNKTGATQASASELYDFMKRVRGQPPSQPDHPNHSSFIKCVCLAGTSPGSVTLTADTACTWVPV